MFLKLRFRDLCTKTPRRPPLEVAVHRARNSQNQLHNHAPNLSTNDGRVKHAQLQPKIRNM